MQMQNFAPLMFAGLVLIMLIGFPVAFSLAALGMGSGLMFLQGLSEIIKRICYLQGIFKMDTHYEKPLQ